MATKWYDIGPKRFKEEIMRKLLTRIWNAEPVILVGAITSAWTAIVAFDQIDDSWAIHTWLYVVAVPLIAFLAAITHKHAQHTDDDIPF